MRRLLLLQELEDLVRRRAVVLDLHRVAPSRWVAQRIDLRPRARLAGLVRADAEVAERDGFLRLLLRAHDPLERGIARLVDRVGDGDHRGQGRLDHVVAELGLPLAAHLPVLVGELGDLRDQRPLQPVGDRGPEHGAIGVVCLLAEEHEVGALALERGREHAAGGDEVRACGALVADEQDPVGAHCEGLAHGLERALRPKGNDHDLTVAGGISQFQRLLDRMDVELVQRPLAGAVEPLRLRIEPPLGGRFGHVLGANGDLHAARTLPRA